MIKVFSSFFFANHDTKTPFYISLISVLLNIFISVYYFSEIGFIIIPIATSISSWFNSILLFLFLSLPATIALIIGSEQIISALFGYGFFNENSVNNSSLALYYFALGLPAFALIKVFSSFFFANHDTRTPFYISLISVILNIFVSIYYFSEIGFIIIPIATSISCLLYTSPSPRDYAASRMPSSA